MICMYVCMYALYVCSEWLETSYCLISILQFRSGLVYLFVYQPSFTEITKTFRTNLIEYFIKKNPWDFYSTFSLSAFCHHPFWQSIWLPLFVSGWQFACLSHVFIFVCICLYLQVYIYVSAWHCLSVCLSVLSVYLSVCLSLCLSVSVSVCVSFCLLICLCVSVQYWNVCCLLVCLLYNPKPWTTLSVCPLRV